MYLILFVQKYFKVNYMSVGTSQVLGSVMALQEATCGQVRSKDGKRDKEGE